MLYSSIKLCVAINVVDGSDVMYDQRQYLFARFLLQLVATGPMEML